MIKNFFKIAVRNLNKNKFFSLISIVGLAVGIAIAVLAGLYAHNELTVDRFNPHYHNIYRLEVGTWFTTPAPLIPIIRSEMPGLEAVAAIDRHKMTVNINNEEQTINDVLYTESDFLSIFPLRMLWGKSDPAFDEPYQMIISESVSKRLFGSANPVGEHLKVNDRYDFTIAGVFQDYPENSILSFNALSAWKNRKTMTGAEDYFENWNNWNYQTFVRLSDLTSPQETIELFNAAFTQLMAEIDSGRAKIAFQLRHLKDIYFFKDLSKNDHCNHGNLQYLILFSTSALLTLLIAIINIINLTTARANLRSAEIGIRKVNGAGKSDLVKQFIGEAFIVSLLSFLVALLLIEILLPHFNGIIGKNLIFNPISNPLMVLFLLAGIVFITFLTGLYPAFFMSSFNMIFILKKSLVRGKSGLQSRRILMVIQFIITISLILGTLIIYSQMKFMVNKDLGYDKEHVLFFAMNSDLKEHETTLKEKLLKNTEIKAASIVHSLPGNLYMEWGRTFDDGSSAHFFSLPCDEDFIPMLNLEIIEGRNFDPKLETDKSAYIVNETFLKKHNISDPASIKIGEDKIIGVVKDFIFQSLHYTIKPLAFTFFTDWSWYMAVKVQGSDIESAQKTIRAICSEFSEKKININFLDDTIAAKYIKDRQFGTIFTVFSVLAILVSSLGLLGLISFEANRRTKEIGIRKVLGATPLEIIRLFNKEIVILISISAVFAWVIGYFWLIEWLQNFAFRIEIKPIYFILSGIVTALLALLTFSILAYKAAMANPVKALKYE